MPLGTPLSWTLADPHFVGVVERALDSLADLHFVGVVKRALDALADKEFVGIVERILDALANLDFVDVIESTLDALVDLDFVGVVERALNNLINLVEIVEHVLGGSTQRSVVESVENSLEPTIVLRAPADLDFVDVVEPVLDTLDVVVESVDKFLDRCTQHGGD